ncbi:MAG: pyridoxal phosphate-dependent aminotransferase [Alphaproteobacteria bacterium]|nr:pyridoxal phosphate-dependent aminotransferase [Alphaproteobacteria bacterium]
MAFLSQAVGRIRPSATVAVASKIAEMRCAGKAVISLGAGEPDFDTPAHIVAAGHQAMLDGKTRYSPAPGVLEFREAIAEKFQRDNNLTYSPDQITVGCGGKQTIFNACLATLDPGDDVVIPTPYWVSYPEIVAMTGATPVFVSCSVDKGFRLDPEDLAAAITPKTKWLILNSPSNPTGVCYSKEELLGFVEVLRRPENQHVWVMTDDMYEHIVYDGLAFHTIAEVAPDLYERTLTLNGLSKAYCMTGWRLGYAAGPLGLIKAMNKIQSQSVSSVSTFSQWAGIAALNGSHDFIATHNAAFVNRRDLVVAGINAIPGLSCPKPEGAFYVCVSCGDLIGKKTPAGVVIENDEILVGYLLEAEGVVCVHGEAFGFSPAFRISYATSNEKLEHALAAMHRAFGALE